MDLTMEIRAQVSMDRPLLSKIVRAAFSRTFLGLRVIGALLVAAGVLGRLVGDTSAFSTFLPLFVGLLVLLTPELLLLMSYRRLGRVADKPWCYVITPDEITEATPMFSSTRPWGGVRTATETAELWLLRTTLGGVIGLPKRAFTEEQEGQVQAILRQHGLVK